MSELTLVSWNLGGLDERWLDERTEAACLHLLLDERPPDVVAVQEVVDRAWIAHLEPHFGHAGYTAIPGRSDSDYGTALFVRAPLVAKEARLHALPETEQGRTLLEVRVDWGGRELLVCTAHLESLRSGSRARRAQLAYALGLVRGHPGPAVFAADTNLRDEELEGLDRTGITDAWEAAGSPARHKWTWDGRWHGRGGRMRFDRVFVNERVTASGFELVGRLPVAEAEGRTPSDHLAVRARLVAR